MLLFLMHKNERQVLQNGKKNDGKAETVLP